MNQKPKETRSITVGGSEGSNFELDFSSMVSLTVGAGDIVDSIAVTDDKGKTLKAGGSGGGKKNMNFAAGEYITAIRGKSGKYIGMLTIETSQGQKQTFGAGGWGSDQYFEFEAGDQLISGLFGKAEEFLISLGVVKSENPMNQVGDLLQP